MASAPRPISHQANYSILRRGLETEVLPKGDTLGVGQIAFSPLAQGALTGKYSGGQIPPQSRARDPKRNRWMTDHLEPEMLARIDALRPWATELGLSMAQLALTWCLRVPSVASVLIGASRIDQLEENVKAIGRALPQQIIDEIDALFPVTQDTEWDDTIEHESAAYAADATDAPNDE